ncbi:DUF2381 family protein [Hyalangium sp.]|uniref:DUF2381 family protein n=1 Tax=Hyalangium sp. TaxID=2028555 RepID=UPI002D73140C|nr:DUF2381 family protein [Hyalangium sp.]HYI00594.1 DUF2381 family protein [Hyalangium sp.]
MPVIFAPGLLALALLGGPVQASSSAYLECESASPRVALGSQPSEALPRVCVSLGLTTSILLNSPIDPDSLVLQERSRFAFVAVTDRSIMLIPPANLSPGETFNLTIGFLDGTAPAMATFVLVGHPALATRQVEVFRQVMSAEAYQRETQEARAEVAHLREQLSRAQMNREQPAGLAGLLAKGEISKGGLLGPKVLPNTIKGAAKLREHWSFRFADTGDVAVSLQLQPRDQERTVTRATLTDGHGSALPPQTFWTSGPVRPTEWGRVVLEWSLSESRAKLTYTLILERDDGSVLRVEEVTFP